MLEKETFMKYEYMNTFFLEIRKEILMNEIWC